MSRNRKQESQVLLWQRTKGSGGLRCDLFTSNLDSKELLSSTRTPERAHLARRANESAFQLILLAAL